MWLSAFNVKVMSIKKYNTIAYIIMTKKHQLVQKSAREYKSDTVTIKKQFIEEEACDNMVVGSLPEKGKHGYQQRLDNDRQV